MNASNLLLLAELMAERTGAVDPSKFPDENFELYSIPAYDRGVPDSVYGREIGSTKQVVRPGDVLLSKIVPHIRRSWIVGPLNGRRIIASGEWIVFRSPMIEPKYLRHVLMGDVFHSQFMRTVVGVGGSLLRARPSQVASIAVPVPNIAEQGRIAAILDKADALRRKRREAIAKLDTLLQSVFLEMFGDPVTNSKGWANTLSLGEVAEIVSGVTKGRSLDGKQTRSVPYLAVANVQDKALQLEPIKWIEATEDEIRRYRLQRNDLVLTEGGDPDKLGRGTIWDAELPECIHQNHIFRVRLTSEELEPRFLNWLIGSQRGKTYFLRSAKQTTGIASINMKQLRGFPLLIPPKPLQCEFVRSVAEIEKLKTSACVAARKLEDMFKSLQHRAFSGETVATDTPAQ